MSSPPGDGATKCRAALSPTYVEPERAVSNRHQTERCLLLDQSLPVPFLELDAATTRNFQKILLTQSPGVRPGRTSRSVVLADLNCVVTPIEQVAPPPGACATQP